MSCQHRGCRCRDAHLERDGRRFCSGARAEKEAPGAHREQRDRGHPDCAED